MPRRSLWTWVLFSLTSVIFMSDVSAQDMVYSVDDQDVSYDEATGEASFSVTIYGEEEISAGDIPALTQGFSVAIAHDNTVLEAVDITLDDTFEDMNGGSGPSFAVRRFAEDDEGVIVAVIYEFTTGDEVFDWVGGQDLFVIDFETIPEEFEDNEDGKETDLEFVDGELFPAATAPATSNVVTIGGASYYPEFNQGTITLEPGETAAIFLRGDFNGDGEVQGLGDTVSLLRWGFVDGDDPPCLVAADFDGDDEVAALLDGLYLLRWAFSSGDAPPDPGTTKCGSDPSEDALECETAPDC